MRKLDLQGRGRRKRHPRTTQANAAHPVAPNLLNQDFTATRSDEKWVADITYVDTAEGWLYLAVVLDVYSRQVVGWSMQASLHADLVLDALHMALGRRQPTAPLLHHSDRGSQYTSADHLALLTQYGITVSMSRTANCYDNALMESFFATLKTECLTEQLVSHHQARAVIFEFIEVWYNRQRRHSSLGYLSPCQFEALHI
jgi:putative transposase